MGTKVDLSGLEKGFVKSAKTYSERKGITYSTWREVGVPADVLEEGRISRARLSRPATSAAELVPDVGRAEHRAVARCPRASSLAPSSPPRSSSSDTATIGHPSSSTAGSASSSEPPARRGVLDDEHAVAGLEHAGDAAADAVALRLLAHREARLAGHERDGERHRDRADDRAADGVEARRVDPRDRERVDDRVADDLHAVAAEAHLPSVEVPVRRPARRQRELTLADRVLARAPRQRGLGGPQRHAVRRPRPTRAASAASRARRSSRAAGPTPARGAA